MKAAFLEKPITFSNKGMQIVGVLHIPRGKSPFPAIVMCHGFTGNKMEDHRLFVTAARSFCEAGFMLLRFDFRGSGDSEGLFEEMTISDELDDLGKALSFMVSQKEVDRSRIGVVGLSLGGLLSIYGAIRYENVAAVVTWSSPAWMKTSHRTDRNFVEVALKRGFADLPSGYRVSRRFYEDRENYEPAEIINKISPKPILIIHGDKDETVPLMEGLTLYENAKEPKELLIVEGGDHTFRMRGAAELVIQSSISFLKENL